MNTTAANPTVGKMRKIIMAFDGTWLWPAYDTEHVEYEKLKKGNFYKVKIEVARNPEHHRKGFKLINQLFDNQDKYTNLDDFMFEIKLLTGWVVRHVRLDGEVTYREKPLNFADCDQLEFEEFYERLIDVAIQKFKFEGIDAYV